MAEELELELKPNDHSPRAQALRGQIKRGRGLNPTCRQCGQVHYGCKAHRRRSRPLQPCTNWPMKGQEVCSFHGGKAPTSLAAAQVRLEKEREMERAVKAVRTLGLPVQTSPQQALLDEIARTAGHVQWLGDMIGEMSAEAITWNKAAEEHQVGVGPMGDAVDMTSTTMQARPAVWVELYQKERAHLVYVSKVAIQCGIAERQIRLAEEQGNAIAGLLRQVFEAEELQLTAIQLTAARSVASRLLRQIKVETRPALSVVKQLPPAVPERSSE